jgi:mono/diheme cytochrome c family protein
MNDILLVLERFLNNELDATERAEVQQKLDTDPAFRQEYDRLIEIRDASKRASQRNLVQKVGKQFHFKKTVQIAAATVIAISAIAASVWAVSTISKTKQEANKRLESNVSTLIAQFDDQKSMKHVPSQYFQLQASDTVVFSENGVLVSVPHDAFLRDGLPYNDAKTIQYQEAMDAGTIIKGGLSTMAGERLLETQGMFGVKAFDKNGKLLEMNPKVGVYLQVPVDGHKKGMQVFKGKPDKDGNLDWVDPTPLEKLPVSANIADLDLFPEKYEPELDRIKWKTSKKSRDSLYLSFDESDDDGVNDKTTGRSLFENNCATCHQAKKDGTGPKLFNVRDKWAKGGAKPGSIEQWVKNFSIAAKNDPYAAAVSQWASTAMNKFPNLSTNEINSIFDYVDGKDSFIVPPRMLTVEEFKYLYPKKSVLLDNNMTDVEAEKLSKMKNPPFDLRRQKHTEDWVISSILRVGCPSDYDVFDNYDIDCIVEGNIPELLKQEISNEFKNNLQVSYLKSFSGRAILLKSKNNKYDTPAIKNDDLFFDSKKIELATKGGNGWKTICPADPSIYCSFEGTSVNTFKTKIPFATVWGAKKYSGTVTCIVELPHDSAVSAAAATSSHIPPSKVLAIWDNKFNNTNLATRDFEKRMKEIHKTNDPKVLAAYTSNLDKSLYEADMMVVKMGYPAFNVFADEHVGKVTASNPHLKNLDDFYKKAIAQLVAEKNKTQENERTKEKAFDNKIATSKEKNVTESIARDAENLQEEYKLNLDDVNRQLGNTVGLNLHSPMGTVVNIDVYVMEATVARKTTTIVDPFSGKTAQIIYSDFSVEIAEYKKYDRVFLYLFPNKMNSFQRIDPIDGKITYSLNNLFTYDMALVGFNKSGMFWKSLADVKKGSKGKQTLTQISTADFESKMASLNKNRRGAEASVTNELDFLKNEQENYKVQALRQEMVLFRQKIRSLIFGESSTSSAEAQNRSIKKIR